MKKMISTYCEKIRIGFLLTISLGFYDGHAVPLENGEVFVETDMILIILNRREQFDDEFTQREKNKREDELKNISLLTCSGGCNCDQLVSDLIFLFVYYSVYFGYYSLRLIFCLTIGSSALLSVSVFGASLAASLLDVEKISLLEAIKRYRYGFLFGTGLLGVHYVLYVLSEILIPFHDNKAISCLLVPLKKISHFIPQAQQQNLVFQLTNLYNYKLANEQSLEKVFLFCSSMKQVSSLSRQPLSLGNGTEKTFSVLQLAIEAMLQDKNYPPLLPPVP